jgi:lipoate-protein ligase A
MVIVHRPQTDPYFNLAAEEYLLRKIEEDCFMLWRNELSIVVGKHQNTYSEINYSMVKENNIPVVRRISGGGTVVHDPGNLNFSFISTGENEKQVDFKRFTQPIIDVLNELSVPAKLEGKNDLRVHGLKVSGNAGHVYKHKVLHHGTLLFSSDLSRLNELIKVGPGRYSDSAIKSIRNKVANISGFFPEPILMDNFINHLHRYISKNFPGTRHYSLSTSDISEIEQLAQSKYATWEWNYGYSPRFTATARFNDGKKPIVMKLTIEKGIITTIASDETDLAARFKKELKGCQFEKEQLWHKMISAVSAYRFSKSEVANILSQLFN